MSRGRGPLTLIFAGLVGVVAGVGAFTFVFKESRHGLFQLHAYPYETGMSTFQANRCSWSSRNRG